MIDAMKQALEALEDCLEALRRAEAFGEIKVAYEAIAALDQAIEQTEQWDTSDMAHRSGGLSVEQEPVAYKYTDKTNPLVFYFTTHKDSLPNPDVIETALYTAPPKRDMSTKPQNVYTSAERVQEIDKSIHEEIERLKAEIRRLQELADYRLQLLMKMPEHKTWVGLTDEEITEYSSWLSGRNVVRAIEQRLKEKNT